MAEPRLPGTESQKPATILHLNKGRDVESQEEWTGYTGTERRNDWLYWDREEKWTGYTGDTGFTHVCKNNF